MTCYSKWSQPKSLFFSFKNRVWVSFCGLDTVGTLRTWQDPRILSEPEIPIRKEAVSQFFFFRTEVNGYAARRDWLPPGLEEGSLPVRNKLIGLGSYSHVDMCIQLKHRLYPSVCGSQEVLLILPYQ